MVSTFPDAEQISYDTVAFCGGFGLPDGGVGFLSGFVHPDAVPLEEPLSESEPLEDVFPPPPL